MIAHHDRDCDCGFDSEQVVSQAEARGKVLVQPSLADIQGKQFDEATVIIAEQVGGMEDIPVTHAGHTLPAASLT